MKTKSYLYFAIISIALSFSLRLAAQASCPLTIKNKLTCGIDITYEIFDAACVSVCGGPQTASIGATSQITVGSGCCGSLYDVYIYVDAINSVPAGTSPYLPAQVSNVNGLCAPTNTLDGGSTSTGCQPSGVWTITWTTGVITIQ